MNSLVSLPLETTNSAVLLFMWTLSSTATTTTRPKGNRSSFEGGGRLADVIVPFIGDFGREESISKVKPSFVEASARPSPLCAGSGF